MFMLVSGFDTLHMLMTTMGRIGAIWGVGGVLLLLGSAIYRLSGMAAEAFTQELLWYHRAAFLVIVIFMAYAEGYRAFQQGFSPRVAARARYLLHNPTLLRVIFAPFFCMGFFHATKRRQITSISVTLGIVILVLLVRLLPQPWRGIIDAGVIIGLAWGIGSLLALSIMALGPQPFDYSPEVPEG